MTDEILPYYNREIKFIQDLAKEFAESHPREAAGLGITASNSDDPHVERLIQAFALLCARIRFKLDDDFPELTNSLLGHLYPHYLAPIPSMAIVRFDPDDELDGYYEVRPATTIEAAVASGEPVRCLYRTCYPVVVRPLTILNARLSGLPLEAPSNPVAADRKAMAVLRVTLGCIGPSATFRSLAADWHRAPTSNLRIFINAGAAVALPIYELLFNQTVSIAIASSPEDRDPIILAPDAIQPVGFDPAEGLLPFGPRSFIGYRLLTEYFAFPEKFLFFDLQGLDASALTKGSKTLDVFIYLKSSDRELEKQIGAETFALGCTPIVNLFNRRAEPIRLTQTEYEYRVSAHHRRERAYEVYSVDRVVASQRGRTVELKPFYAIDHGNSDRQPFHSRTGNLAAGPYWHLMRRQAAGERAGTDIFLSFVDADFRPNAPVDWTISVDTSCLNAELPRSLESGGLDQGFKLVEGASGLAGVTCLTSPTPTLRMSQGNGARWRLLSHLILNHLSLLDNGAADGAGAEALKETLRLYDIRDNEATRKAIDLVRSVSHHRGLARVPRDDADTTSDTVCHGINVEIEFDRGGLPGGSLYLLAAVLERYLAMACSINAFTRVTARATNEEDPVKTWPPRAGSRILL